MILFDPSGNMTSDDGAGLDGVIEGARASIVAVTAPGRGGSGFVALANGVVVTTHDAVGFELEVSLTLDDGQRVEAHVVAVDVASNVALLLPSQPLGVPALRPAPTSSAALGTSVVALARARGGGLVAASGVTSGEVALRGVEWLCSSARLGVAGGALLDREGRVVGLASPGPRGVARGPLVGELVAPLRVFDELLRAVDRPSAQLAGREPQYRCPACDARFDVEDDRCLACGAALPHAFALDGAGVVAERLVRELLERHGVGANRVRASARSWRFALRSAGSSSEAQIVLRVDRAGRTAVLRAPIAGLTAGAAHEALYRLLLTLCDQSTGDLRLSIGDGDVVFLTLAMPVADLGRKSAGERVVKLSRDADHYRALLSHAYELEALREADDPEPA